MSLPRHTRYEVARKILNTVPQQAVLDAFPVLDGLETDHVTALEEMIIVEYLKMDKYKVYQVFTADMPFDALKAVVAAIPDRLGYLGAGDADGRYNMLSINTDTSVEIVFCAFDTRTVRIFEDDGSTHDEPEDILYIFAVEIFKAADGGSIVVVKYPPLVKEHGKLYNYINETQFVLEWFDQTVNSPLTPIHLKKFFEWMSSGASYEKTGFKTRELANATGVVNAEFSIDLGQNPKVKPVYARIDSLIMPQVWSDVEKRIKRLATQSNVQLDARSMKLVEQALVAEPFCEEYFNFVHQNCSYGRGYLLYQKDKIKLNYTLEYERNRYDLIRVNRQSWGMFEPIFKEIRRFIENP